MIIDDNTVLIDSQAVTSAAVTGSAVGLTSLLKPGRAEPIHVVAKVVEEDFAGGTSIAFKLQQGDTEDDDSFEDVPGSEVTALLADLTLGKCIGWRFLPPGVSKPWIKMVATPTGTFTAGKIFAAVVREEEQHYEEGMYIDAGQVKG